MKARVLGLTALSVLTIAINGTPLVPVGLLIALPLVARSAGAGSFWTGLVDNRPRVLALLGGLAVGVLGLQVSCDVQARDAGFGLGLLVRPLPVRQWWPASTAEQAAGLYNRGLALENQGRCDQALDLYRRAAELTPDDPAPWHQLCACLLMQLDDPGQAKQACLEAQRRAPNEAEPRYKLAIANLMLEDFARAEHWARRALEEQPRRDDASNVLAIALLNQGEQTEAGALMKKLVEQVPDKALYRKNYALWLADQGQCQPARTQLKRAAELGADLAAARQKVAAACPRPRPE